MITLRAVLALAACLAVEIVMGLWAPGLRRYVDVMMLPPIGFALAVSQRSAMAVGCASGLLQDAWLQAELFGSSGFVKTLLGWALGELSARFELNGTAGRAAAGALFPVADRFAELGVRKLFDQGTVLPGAGELAVRAVAGSLLTLAVFAILDRVKGFGPRKGRRPRPTR